MLENIDNIKIKAMLYNLNPRYFNNKLDKSNE